MNIYLYMYIFIYHTQLLLESDSLPTFRTQVLQPLQLHYKRIVASRNGWWLGRWVDENSKYNWVAFNSSPLFPKQPVGWNDHLSKVILRGWNLAKNTFEYNVDRSFELHPWSLTWNLKISPWKRRFLLETVIFRLFNGWSPGIHGGFGIW